MKATIENPLTFLINERKNREMFSSFNHLIDKISKANNDKELRQISKNEFSKYFDIGFGGNHMWVHQNKQKGKQYINTSKRILFVEF